MNPRAHSRLGLPLPVSILPFSLLLLLACATPALPQATFPSPVLTSIFPLGARQGSEVELTLAGTDLDAPQAILLSSSKGPTPHHSLPVQGVPGKANVVRFRLPETSTSYHDIRLVGRYGVSNPRGFLIHLSEDIKSPGSNTTRETALKIKPDSVVHGVFRTADPLWFSFHATSGQRIVLTVDQRDLDTRAVVQGVLLRADGQEVARIRRTALDWQADGSGEYFLKVNELMHRAGDDYAFSLIAHAMPAHRPAENVASTSVTQPEVLQAPALLRRPFGNEPSVFDLDLKAGEKVVFQVKSHQLGHPSDPHLFIQEVKADGTLKPVAEPADAPVISPTPALPLPNRDPSYAYDAKAATKLRITLNDNFKTNSPFEFHVIPAHSGFPQTDLIALNATLPPAAPRKGYEVGTANVCRGGILALEVVAPNRTASSDAIELKADAAKLPPGLTCLGGYIGPGQSLGYLAFQAAPDAAPGAATVDTISDAAYVQFAVADVARDPLLIRHTRPPAVGISALTAPALVLTEAAGILEVAADGKLEIPLKVTRQVDFQGALTLKLLGLVDVAKAPEVGIPAKATTGKLTVDVKALKLLPGEYGCILQGPAKAKYRRNLEELGQAENAAKQALAEQKAAQMELEKAKADTSPAKQQLIATATASLKKATAAKTTADQRLKDLGAKAAPKEATFIVYSNPIRFRVKGK